MKKKAFILVGHSHWGKSLTLKALTKGDVRTRHLRIPKINRSMFAYVRRISNDDNEQALLQFSRGLASRIRQDYLILTFCPKINPSRNSTTILNALMDTYDLYFYVLWEDYSRERKITNAERAFLQGFASRISILRGHYEAAKRAEGFAEFVRDNL
jgi:hypothetical protein